MGTTRGGPAEAATTAPDGSRKRIGVVLAVVFIDLLGFGIIIPILPFYVRSFGVSDIFIGLLAASYSLAQFLAAPVLGRLSDQRGRRPVIMLSVGVSGVAWILFGIASEIGAVAGTTVGLLVLFGARLTAGAAGGNIAAAQAYIADVTPPERRTGALGLIGAAFGLGFVFGPALGGVLASDPAVNAGQAVFPDSVPITPFTLPSFGAATLSFVALAAATVFLKEPERKRGPANRTTFVGQFQNALSDTNIRPLVIAFFLTSVAFAGVTVMFIPFMADFFGYDATEAAIFLAYIGVLGIINQGILIGRLANQFGVRPVVKIGALCLALALLLLAAAPLAGTSGLISGGPSWLSGGFLVLLVFGLLLSFGNGALSVGLASLVSENTGAETQGSAFGVTQAAGSLGRTIGPPVAAGAYVVVYWSPFVGGALLLVPVWLLMGMKAVTQTNRSTSQK